MTSILFRNARVSRLAAVARINRPAALISQRSPAGLRRDASRPEPHSP